MSPSRTAPAVTRPVCSASDWGQRTQNANTNGGKAYFGLTISGPLSHPTGGGVIAYSKSKRWGGRGVSFKGNAHGGTFVAQGINGSRGTATGSFRC